MKRMSLVCALAFLLAAGGSVAQLPPDAVDLSKVKIPEKQKSQELDPVTLEPADPNLPTFEYKGVTYGQSSPDSKTAFFKAPDEYAQAAAEQRWENNFVQAMSRIWCPVTDEISAGGGLIWQELGLEWESCCQFCNDTKTDEDFPRALKRLKKRAAKAYELTNGKYVNDAASPVEGAIDLGGPAPVAEEETEGATKMASAAYLEGKDLEATFTGGVGLIFQERCIECHRPMGVSPMSFTSYGEIRKWTKNMKEQVENRTMPPWPADPSVGSFGNSKRLTQKEFDLLVEWIDAGFPHGDGEFEFDYNEDWIIGEPDHVFELDEFVVPEDVADHVREFQFDTDFEEDKWIVAGEVIPTDIFFIYEVNAEPLGSYHAGQRHQYTPAGKGYLLKAGESVNIRTFYMKEKGWEEYDDMTKIGVKFADDPSAMEEALKITRLANDEFTIPAGEVAEGVTAEYTFEDDGKIVSFNPVMRQRGKSLKVTATLPDGTTKDLLSIPHWDPMYNFRYELAEALDAPKGTKVTVSATFDNTDMNAKNPNPSVEVKAGPNGELLEGWMEYTID